MGWLADSVASLRTGGPMGPEWIDDPNERLIALMHQHAVHGDEALAEMKRIGYRDMIWRPYLRAGAPYGEDEAGAMRWADERKALAVEPEPSTTQSYDALVDSTLMGPAGYYLYLKVLRQQPATISVDDAIRAQGDDPAEVRRSLLMDRLRQDPAYQMIKAQALTSLDIKDAIPLDILNQFTLKPNATT